jgi:hypothetical protein
MQHGGLELASTSSAGLDKLDPLKALDPHEELDPLDARPA